MWRTYLGISRSHHADVIGVKKYKIKRVVYIVVT
jgi:hypothetical protein